MRDIETLITHPNRLIVNQVRLIVKAWAAPVDAEIALRICGDANIQRIITLLTG